MPPRPRVPEAGPLTGTETVFVMQDGKQRRTTVAAILAEMEMPAALAARVLAGAAGTAIKIDPVLTTLVAVIPLISWAGDQMIVPTVRSSSRSAITLDAKRTRGTLLLSGGPMENAPAGTPVSAIVLGT
jgi:hypothetical protein